MLSWHVQLREQERRDILSQVTSDEERARLEALFDEKRQESHARLEAMQSGTTTPRTSKPAQSSTMKRAHFNGAITGHHVEAGPAQEHPEPQASDEAAATAAGA